jgi:drug/metabolite transporter (DMT)-like permease
VIDRNRGASGAAEPLAVICALAVGVAFTLVTVGLYKAFGAGAPITIVSPLVRLGGLVLASITGLVLWQEPITGRCVLGVVLAIAGIYLIMTR